MKKTIIYLYLSLVLASCAVQVKNVELKRRIIDDVPLNTLIKNEIGDKLITTGEEDYQDAMRIVESPDFSLSYAFVTLEFPYKRGQVLPLTSYSNEWLLFYNSKDVRKSGANGDDIYFGIAVSKKDETIVVPFVKSATSYGAFITKKVEGFKTKTDIFTDNNCTDCFKQEFIYNGKTGSSLKFIYREYVNDMARPAFNQELQYDLNESNIVGFKGLRIEIVNATNTKIEYKILSSFNKPK